MIPPTPRQKSGEITRPFWQSPACRSYNRCPPAARAIDPDLGPESLTPYSACGRAGLRAGVPPGLRRRPGVCPGSSGPGHPEVHSRSKSHETHATGTGDRGVSAIGVFDRAGGRAEAQVPGGTAVYETVSPGYNTVTYGERVRVRRGPFKTVIKERPVAYVTRTPPVVRETRYVQPAPVVENVVVQPAPIYESVYVQPAPVLERRLIQPAPVIQSRVIQSDPVVQTDTSRPSPEHGS